MGCNSYEASGSIVKFDEVSDDCRCLCTFPHNDGETLDPERVRSLALLGAAVAMLHAGENTFVTLPHSLPDWVDLEIKRNLGITERD